MSTPSASPRSEDPTSSAPNYVVGIGASAGGIKALNEFFAAVPTGTGASYVVVLHLLPDHDSQLAQVLQRTAHLPVVQVREQMPVEVEHIYVIPPNANLELSRGQLVVSPLAEGERHAPVDVLFRSLAAEYGNKAASVVLSGTGPNGSSGLKLVKENGGLTLAQDPQDAEHAEMPNNAVATALVDLVLPADRMAKAITDYFQRLLEKPRAPEEPSHAQPEADAVGEILRILRTRTGHDFSNYKLATVLRRIERRCHLRSVPTVQDYARLMREDPEEAVPLMKDLLISVTTFFRDPEAFAVLEQRVIPRLFAGRQKGDQVRAWVAGCATGEEAYSVAMLLSEAAARMAEAPSIQVFATDLDRHAIGVARDGHYTVSDVASISEERVQRFFERSDSGGYRVHRWLRELVLFAEHNLVRDPPFSHLDLITCRNLLIYLNRSIQERVIETFHFALKPSGYLFLGASEAPSEEAGLFVALHKDARIYEGRIVSGRLALPVSHTVVADVPRTQGRQLEARQTERLSPGELHHRLLEQYAAPSIVVTEDHLVLHVSERAGQYLEVGPGEPSRDVFKLLKPELRLELRTALHEAGQTRSAVEIAGLRWPGAAGDVHLRIIVRPVLRDGPPTRGFFLILFEEGAPAPLEAPAKVSKTEGGVVIQMAEELARVKAQLRATIEQYETQVEEAKASNEELQAVNEELRSSAEELETSKEELQSVNEELTTVNQELKIKIEELGLTNNDLQNFINATDVATIFLDRDLRVKLSTQRARELFHLLPSDTGRRLSDFTNALRYDGLHEDVGRVQRRLDTVEREVETRDGLAYLMRLLPYRTIDDRIDGVVLTFVDITRRRKLEQDVRTGEERLRLLVASAADYAIFTMADDGRVDMWNAGAERIFGYTSQEIIGQDVAVLFTPEDRAAGVPEGEREHARRHGRASDERYHLRKDGTRFYASGVVSRLDDGDGAGRQQGGFLKIARDLTAKREADLALENAHASLEMRVQQRTRELQEEIERRRAAQEHALKLLRQLVTSQEDQRARIARDLHDELGQQLTALRLTLERSRERSVAGNEECVAELDRALDLSRAINAEIDFLAWELRPAALDDLGLQAALPQFLKEWSRHHGIAAEFRAARFLPGQLTPEAEVTFYRIAQETLNNVVKHAHASRVDVILESRDDFTVLLIEDDGVGFDPGDLDTTTRGIGLAGMAERASLSGASLQIESAPGKGTTVFLRQPVNGTQEREPAS